VTIFAVDKQQVLHILSVGCSLTYQACNAHASYCQSVACPPLRYFSTLPYERHNFFWGGIMTMKCVFWFSLQLLLS